MIDRDIWLEIYHSLRANRLRTLLTAAGIFWGIFILILMLGFGNGIESGVNRSMQGYAANVLYVWGGRTSEPWQGMPPGRSIRLNNDDVSAIRSALPIVHRLAPRARLGRWRSRNEVRHGTLLTDAEVMGDTPEMRWILPMELRYGRFINPLDIEQKRKVAVIGERVHRDLFGADDPIGERIQISGVTFSVVGVFRPRYYGRDRERLQSTTMLPLSTFQQVFNRAGKINYLAMLPVPGGRSAQMDLQVRALLERQHRVAPGDRRAFGGWSSEKDFLRIANLFRGINAFIWTVGIATLLAGVLGVSNIMLIVVRERRREFGIRKCLGATPGAVIRMILLETSTLVGVAGLTGLFAGLAVLQLIDRLTRDITSGVDAEVLFATPTIDLRVALAALGALLLAALLAAVIPARHATAIAPAEAVRAE